MCSNLSKIHLQLDHLAVGYRGKAIISGIEIGVKKGEILTLIGPNGAGKSTILRTIARQLRPVGGDIRLTEGAADGSAVEKRLAQYAPEELAERMAVMLTGRLQTDLMTCRDVASMGR